MWVFEDLCSRCTPAGGQVMSDNVLLPDGTPAPWSGSRRAGMQVVVHPSGRRARIVMPDGATIVAGPEELVLLAHAASGAALNCLQVLAQVEAGAPVMLPEPAAEAGAS